MKISMKVQCSILNIFLAQLATGSAFHPPPNVQKLLTTILNETVRHHEFAMRGVKNLKGVRLFFSSVFNRNETLSELVF